MALRSDKLQQQMHEYIVQSKIIAIRINELSDELCNNVDHFLKAFNVQREIMSLINHLNEIAHECAVFLQDINVARNNIGFLQTKIDEIVPKCQELSKLVRFQKENNLNTLPSSSQSIADALLPLAQALARIKPNLSPSEQDEIISPPAQALRHLKECIDEKIAAESEKREIFLSNQAELETTSIALCKNQVNAIYASFLKAKASPSSTTTTQTTIPAASPVSRANTVAASKQYTAIASTPSTMFDHTNRSAQGTNSDVSLSPESANELLAASSQSASAVRMFKTVRDTKPLPVARARKSRDRGCTIL